MFDVRALRDLIRQSGVLEEEVPARAATLWATYGGGLQAIGALAHGALGDLDRGGSLAEVSGRFAEEIAGFKPMTAGKLALNVVPALQAHIDAALVEPVDAIIFRELLVSLVALGEVTAT